jgi:hydrogenase maturation protein HypF
VSLGHLSQPVDGDAEAPRRAAEERHETIALDVQGTVQGVGFRPTVHRLATELGLAGTVGNEAHGVVIRLRGGPRQLDAFLHRLQGPDRPPLARIDAVTRRTLPDDPTLVDFVIAASGQTADAAARVTDITPDAATCSACLAETLDPTERRYRYPFTNCTHCGPRFSIVEGLPYDRPRTTMGAFPLCGECAEEYADPTDRRFHAQPVACHRCGPRAWLARADGRPFAADAFTMMDDVDAVCSLLQRGEIVAIKGLGGFHLACDATREDVVAELRQRKGRGDKPLALMARDLDVIRRHARVSPEEAAVLQSPAAPIVLLDALPPDASGTVPAESRPRRGRPLAPGVAPGHRRLGFMLPTTPLHHLLLRRMDRPVVMTSGNRSDEPQCITDAQARETLSGVAAWFLFHDRPIAHRVDDSVVRVSGGRPRLLRRARGYAPAPIPLPSGFAPAPRLLCTGGDLKAAFALVQPDGRALLSPHLGDLEHPAAFDAWGRALALLQELYGPGSTAAGSSPSVGVEAVVVDRHPEYRSREAGLGYARDRGLPVLEVQHHHAHVAACLAENGVPRETRPVLGIALDGVGWGDAVDARGSAVWGGELLLADYREATRLATFKPVALLGGDRASREPWRNLYAHLRAEMSWAELQMNFGHLDAVQHLRGKPWKTLDAMLASGRGAPLASSAGRLFDAVAAALDLRREEITYEGQAAMELEALVDDDALRTEDEALAYPFATPRHPALGLPYLEPVGMWRALLGDLHLGTPPGVIAARFHRGLAKGLAMLVRRLRGAESTGGLGGEDAADADRGAFDTVALTGGVFQNEVLRRELARRLDADNLRVLTHAEVPAGDGGLALGQAAIGAARLFAPIPTPPEPSQENR